MIDVYKFYVYDLTSDTLKLSGIYATEKFISSIAGAKLISESKKQIDSKLLDGNGAVATEQIDL